MYEIYKDGVRISIEDKARFVKLQSNGTYCLCTENEAQGVVVGNDYICHLEGKPALPGVETVTIEEFDGATYIEGVYTAADERILELEYENLLLKGGPIL